MHRVIAAGGLAIEMGELTGPGLDGEAVHARRLSRERRANESVIAQAPLVRSAGGVRSGRDPQHGSFASVEPLEFRPPPRVEIHILRQRLAVGAQDRRFARRKTRVESSITLCRLARPANGYRRAQSLPRQLHFHPASAILRWKHR